MLGFAPLAKTAVSISSLPWSSLNDVVLGQAVVQAVPNDLLLELVGNQFNRLVFAVDIPLLDIIGLPQIAPTVPVVVTPIHHNPSYVRFGGAGELRAYSSAQMLISARFGGVGRLSARVKLGLTASARFVGAGALRANTVHFVPLRGAVEFAGTAALRANATHVTPLQGAVRFAGAGRLSAEAIQHGAQPGAVSFLGSGNLRVSIAQRHFIAATFAGSGSLLAAEGQTFPEEGLGAIGEFPIGQQSDAIQLPFPKAIAATLSGSGLLSGNAVRVKPIGATLPGSSTLSINATQQQQISARFAGAGSLRINWFDPNANNSQARIGTFGEFPFGQQSKESSGVELIQRDGQLITDRAGQQITERA